MNLLLFIITILVAFIIVRIGAIAFELTGLEWSLAKFQALSCFSGTGFTTKEAELITGHPKRRKIASVLMILGNAGLVTLMATFANSLRPRVIVAGLENINIPYLNIAFPRYVMPYVNLFIIIMLLYIFYRIYTKTHLPKRITALLRKYILKNKAVNPVSHEEMLVATGGYGIISIQITDGSFLLHKSLKETKLTDGGNMVLSLEREGEFTPKPSAKMKLRLNDTILCFGKMSEILDYLGN